LPLCQSAGNYAKPTGFEVTDQYKLLEAHGAYFCDWQHQQFKVTGGDRATFLHNMCTADIAKLGVGQTCEAFFTNVKGHVLGHGWISCRADCHVVQLFQTDAAPLLAHLDRYIIREDVQLSAEDSCSILLVGPTGPPSLAAASNIEPFNLLSKPTWLIETKGTRAALETELDSFGYQQGDAELFEALRVESGWPLAGIDFSDATLPQELNRDLRAISFTKGCYLGQETVARIDALGHVNKTLVGVQFTGDSVPPLGLGLVHADKPVGQVTSVAWSPARDAPLGLAMVRRPANAAGTLLSSEGGEATVVDFAGEEI